MQNADAGDIARLLPSGRERPGEATGQRGQQEPAAVHGRSHGPLGAGSENVNVEPTPGSLLTQIRPP